MIHYYKWSLLDKSEYDISYIPLNMTVVKQQKDEDLQTDDSECRQI